MEVQLWSCEKNYDVMLLIKPDSILISTPQLDKQSVERQKKKQLHSILPLIVCDGLVLHWHIEVNPVWEKSRCYYYFFKSSVLLHITCTGINSGLKWRRK